MAPVARGLVLQGSLEELLRELKLIEVGVGGRDGSAMGGAPAFRLLDPTLELRLWSTDGACHDPRGWSCPTSLLALLSWVLPHCQEDSEKALCI